MDKITRITYRTYCRPRDFIEKLKRFFFFNRMFFVSISTIIFEFFNVNLNMHVYNEHSTVFYASAYNKKNVDRDEYD